MKKRRVTKQHKDKPRRVTKQEKRDGELRAMIREAVQTGFVAAIEHTQNFWDVSQGFRKYIDQQIKLESDALMAAVTKALRIELDRRSTKRKK